VQQHDWEQLAPGLLVSISLGAAQTLPHDTRDSLMARADSRMYGDKRLRVAWD
jgi:GGDEF domain-containing protein